MGDASVTTGVARLRTKFTLLEPMRGFAALWVFCFHFPFSAAFRDGFPRVYALLRIGDLGVPMFFVISGYCIAASARSSIRNREPWGSFLYRRARRIYPPFWCSLVVVAAIPFVIEALSSLKTGRYVLPASGNVNYGYMRYSLLDWLMVSSLAQVFRPVAGAMNLQYKFTTINAVYWTLAIEVQFYLAATVAMASRRFFYPVILVITAASLPFLFIPSSYAVGVFLPYWPMFAVGIGLYWLFERGLTPSGLLGPAAVPLACAVGPGLAIVFVARVLSGYSIGHLGFALGFGLFLFLVEGVDRHFVEDGLGSRRGTVRLASRLLVTLGAMSYSLYLLHGRLQYLVMQPLRQVLPADSLVFDLAIIAATCLICYGFHLLCERPFTYPARRPPTPLWGRIKSGNPGGGLGSSRSVRDIAYHY
jgi:peptidoglycan/LPS O-acetylase OafA/YrhL